MPINNFRTPEGDIENQSFITESWLVDQWIGDQLWVWGINDFGYLGTNDITGRTTPVTTFLGGTNWKQASVGNRHAAVIKTDGSLWLWGRNDSGNLGQNTAVNRSTPVTTFSGGNNWKQVSCGGLFTAAIKTDGTLWTWGSNINGQLGDNTITSRSTPVTTSAGGNNWKQVSCGYDHILAIKTDGSLWAWGKTTDGRLGIDFSTGVPLIISTPTIIFSGQNNWKQVSAGNFQSAAIKMDGTLWTWGSNSYGQLGTNNTITSSTPVTTFAGGNNWKQVNSLLAELGCSAIKTDGTLWSWGRNTNGLLAIGNNTFSHKSTPVTTFAGGNNWKQISDFSAIKTDGTLWTWGAVPGDNTLTQKNTPVTTFAGGNNWKQVVYRGNLAIAITSGLEY